MQKKVVSRGPRRNCSCYIFSSKISLSAPYHDHSTWCFPHPKRSGKAITYPIAVLGPKGGLTSNQLPVIAWQIGLLMCSPRICLPQNVGLIRPGFLLALPQKA